jgi:hypothetical protein
VQISACYEFFRISQNVRRFLSRYDWNPNPRLLQVTLDEGFAMEDPVPKEIKALSWVWLRKIDNGPMGLQFPGESGDVEWVEYNYKFLSYQVRKWTSLSNTPLDNWTFKGWDRKCIPSDCIKYG